MSLPIDLDRLESWPPRTRSWAQRYIDSLTTPAEYVADLAISEPCEAAFRHSLVGRSLIAYHATRLLPHEVVDIRSRGLMLLDEAHVRQRIAAAVASGGLPSEALAHAEAKNVFATGHQAHRENQVCLVAGRSIFDEDPDAVEPLLQHWGGEAIRGGAGDVAACAGVGTPSIVVATVIPYGRPEILSFPTLPKLFAGKALGLDRAYADLFHRAAIPATDILAVWQPGEPSYDMYPKLPR